MTSSTLTFLNVESSNVASIAFDQSSSELHVKFNAGGHYAYKGVSIQTFGSMLAAESVGKFLNENIKPLFSFVQVDDVSIGDTEDGTANIAQGGQ